MVGKDRLALISRNPDLEVETVLKTVVERHGAVYRTVSTLENILQVTNQQTNNSNSAKTTKKNILRLRYLLYRALQATNHLQVVE